MSERQIDLDQKWYSLTQVAKMFGVSKPTAHAWVRSGKIDAINVSQGEVLPLWRIGEHAIQDFIERRNAKR